MKNLILYVSLLFCLGVAACSPKGEGFTVSGHLSDCGDVQLMVSENIPKIKSWFIDTIEVKDGKFSYTGKLEYPEMMVFSIMKGEEFLGSFGVFMDNCNVKISGSARELEQLKIEGSPLHDEYVRIKQDSRCVMAAYNDIRQRRGEAFKTDKKLYDSLGNEYEATYRKVQEYVMGVENYKFSDVVPYVIYSNFNISRPDMLEELIGALDSSKYSNPYVSYLLDDLSRERKVGIGAMAYDFELPDRNGKLFKLSDCRGKYVLVEFTASWCGWCKKEIPYLTRLYEETKGKNLEMVTIYVDKSKEAWENDLKEHPLPWTILCDLNALEGPAPQAYNVHGIPAIFLIAPDGTIKAKGLRGDAMVETIKGLL